MMSHPYTVWDLTAYIRSLFDQDPALQDVWVEGEISRPKRVSSGHFYFTLKDDRSAIDCVMWRTQFDRLPFDPQHGDAVLAHGSITVYEAQGRYQLYCDALQPAGAGDLNRRFELLKARLDAEGLFDPARKRPIPAFPRQIGVVTSPTTAAFQDIQNVLRRRYPVAEVILSPTLVQGKDAPAQIVAALARLNDHTDVDVIVLARGGGSLEDLWCFNDETVVRAVAASRLPVVTGVGHEIDFTLVDFAADRRAPTPSAAAELVTPDGPALRQTVRLASARLDGAVRAGLDERREGVRSAQRWMIRLSPHNRVQTARQRIDDLTGRANTHVLHALARRRDRLTGQVRALEAAHPYALLRRGYAVVTREDGERIASAREVGEGARVVVTLHDGRLTAAVERRELDEPNG
jgi:exodeoxyribonuclease VII large subunit